MLRFLKNYQTEKEIALTNKPFDSLMTQKQIKQYELFVEETFDNYKQIKKYSLEYWNVFEKAIDGALETFDTYEDRLKVVNNKISAYKSVKESSKTIISYLTLYVSLMGLTADLDLFTSCAVRVIVIVIILIILGFAIFELYNERSLFDENHKIEILNNKKAEIENKLKQEEQHENNPI